MAKKYYEAYDERYKIVHAKGVSWLSDQSSPIVLNTIKKYRLDRKKLILEIGCGEGRDAKAVLDSGYKLLATDISEEAVAFCKKKMPSYKDSFEVLDCGTSCRKVSFETFEKEINSNHLEIIEKGITSALPDFNSLMFAIVKKKCLFNHN